jgi:hypothetical protein
MGCHAPDPCEKEAEKVKFQSRMIDQRNDAAKKGRNQADCESKGSDGSPPQCKNRHHGSSERQWESPLQRKSALADFETSRERFTKSAPEDLLYIRESGRSVKLECNPLIPAL